MGEYFMPYIYKITNIINNKSYIGKTVETVEERFKRHCKDYKKSQVAHRPLYSAIKKYGINNFKVEELEECSIELLNEREKYWIKYYDSYGKGYNATRGGDGVAYADYELIYSLWINDNSMRAIQKITGYSMPTIKNALNNYQISKEERIQKGNLLNHNIKKVIMIDIKTNESIRIFDSAEQAGKFLGKINGSHISDVCKGKRKTAYGYLWKYVSNE